MRRKASPPPPPPPSRKSCGSRGSRRRRGSGASISSLALLSPLSPGAGTDLVGWSPRLARLGLVSEREAMDVNAMRWLQPRQRAWRRLSDEAACRRTHRAARFATRCALGMVWLVWLPAGAVAAPGRDPLHSPECLRARAELDTAFGAPDARRNARLQQARQSARQACLGREAASRQRSGAPEPPQVVAPPALREPPAAAVPAPPATVPAPALSIPRPAAITTCDPGGCWDSEGRRLNQMGPQLVGPRGVCTVQGGMVICP